jgi:hypothetical protein
MFIYPYHSPKHPRLIGKAKLMPHLTHGTPEKLRPYIRKKLVKFKSILTTMEM